MESNYHIMMQLPSKQLLRGSSMLSKIETKDTLLSLTYFSHDAIHIIATYLPKIIPIVFECRKEIFDVASSIFSDIKISSIIIDYSRDISPMSILDDSFIYKTDIINLISGVNNHNYLTHILCNHKVFIENNELRSTIDHITQPSIANYNFAPMLSTSKV